MTTKRKNKISGWFRKIPLNIGTFIFGALFVYMVITVILYLTADHIQSYQVTAGPLSNNKTYTALAIREESVVNTNVAGYITYYARENSKVGKSGAVYTLGDTPAQAAVNELTEQDYAGIRSSIAGFASTYDSDNFYDVYNYKYELEGSSLQYSGLQTDDSTETTQTANGQTIYRAAQDGIVVYAVDGYEGITADQLTSDLFSKKNYQITNLQKERKVSSGDPVYKLITSETWSVVIPLSTDQIVSLAEKKTIRVKFLKDDATQTGLLTIVTGEDGNYYGKITFSRGMIRYSGDRFLNIELVTNTQTGLKIPLSSIVKKNFYVIPKEYIATDEEDGNAGFYRKVTRRGKDDSSEFVKATIYQEDDDYYYVDMDTFQDGDVILKPDSQSVYEIKEKKALEGVYCINKGYAVFRKIVMIEQNDEYCIVETGTTYGLSQFDYIVRNGNTVKEDDILFK